MNQPNTALWVILAILFLLASVLALSGSLGELEHKVAAINRNLELMNLLPAHDN